MLIRLQPGRKYVVAVSGGVDSVVLLDILAKHNPKTALVVAHFDHGIRRNSAKDALFVKALAKRYNLRYSTTAAELGPQASEDEARRARYGFLRSLAAEEEAALVTAHHLDDFLETVVMNYHRGCGRRGLVSLQSSNQLFRPLLRIPKQRLVDYAQANELEWMEDATNADRRYLRNYIRAEVMPKFSPAQKQELLEICERLLDCNHQLDEFLTNYLHYQSFRRAGQVYSRAWFNRLSHAQACEVATVWLAAAEAGDYTQRLVEYIVVKLKTLPPGKQIAVAHQKNIALTKRSIRLQFQHPPTRF